ncbi:MAG: NfeD family protein [Phycisphaerales bacterium]|nr:NfeD family protein [Phycisphaerales bacterium]
MTEPMLWWGLGLFGAAALVVLLEMFVPSGGILAALSTGLAIAGVVSFWRHSPAWGLTSLAALLTLGPLVTAFMLKIYPDTFIGRRMILGGDGPEDGPAPETDADDASALVGAEGVAATDLRPVGTIRIDGKRVEALAEVGMIEAGARVRVVSVEGTRIRVRAVG